MRVEQPKQPHSATVDRLLKTALVHHQAGRLPYAEALYRQILQDSPGHLEASHLLGVIESQTGNYAIALELIDKAILLKPDFAEAYSNRGLALQGLRQYQLAIESFDKAIFLKPDYAEAYNNRGNVLLELQHYQQALDSFDRVLLLKPDCVSALYGRGNALQRLRQYQAALLSFDQVILLLPEDAGAYGNRGNALLGLVQYQQALDSFDKVIFLQPQLAEGYNGRGTALHGLQQYRTALECFDQAILLKPDLEEAYKNRGNSLCGLEQYRAALENFDRVLLLKPDYDFLPGLRLNLKRSMCDWEDTESQCRDLEARIDRNEKVTPPFELLAISGSPALQKKAAEIFVADTYPPWPAPETIARRPKRDRIRIGYFSADFHRHAICYLMAELFERHDRSRFELLAFSFGQDENDEMRIRVTAAMDRFLDVRSLSDREVVRLSRELEVDIAVDLMGFTQYQRTGIFLQRAAPIQVNYLGYPATMGAEFIDYLVADPTLIPEAQRRHYSEKIAYLPDSFQANDSTLLPSTEPYSRAGEGLPEQGFVYCCFNSNHKFSPATFDIWMRILERVDGSVLWLLEANLWSGDNLRKEAVRRGMSPERLIFAPRLPMSEHLARLPLADLFLDTLPFNAGATASPALWAGLPLLTCMGEVLASRMGASLLRAIGLPELVTTTPADYETLAVALALDKERYQELRERLRHNRLTAPLFDVPRFARHLEAAYSAMYERHQAGLLPDHIHIASLPTHPASSPGLIESLMKSKDGAPFRSEKESFPSQPADPVSRTARRLLQEAIAHHQLGQLPQAETLYRQILQVSPDHPDALHMLGMLACQVQNYAMGLELIDRAIICKPGFAEAYNNRGSALHGLHQYQAALESFDKAIHLRPDYAEAYNNRSNPLLRLQQHQAALESCNRAILSSPNYAEAYNNRGNALLGLQRYQAALESCDQAILLKPDYAEAYSNRGSALHALQQNLAALQSYDQAILLKPNNAEAYSNRASAFLGLQQYQAALESCDQAILLQPDYAEAYSNRAGALFRLQQYQAALESCDRAILLKPGLAEAYNNRGNTLYELHQYRAALESFDQAILLNPDLAEAYKNRGNSLYGFQQYRLALESFDRALLLNPDYDYLPGMQLHLRQIMCDWENIESQCRDLESRIDRNEKVTPPLPFLAISSSPALQKKAAEMFVADNYPPRRTSETIARRIKRDRIRLGYFSADFHRHAICYLMAELFERHDRSRFELLAFSFGEDENDDMRIRVTAAMDRFLDVRFLSDREVARLSRELEVDIAVDLMGFTQYARTGIFAQRAAPIQINYLGYPATMGAEFIDYLVADPTLIPEAHRRHYSEKIAYLPDSFQANDSTLLPSTKPYTRAGEGLPERGFIYCCFNSNHKITPATFDIWMRILERVDGSVLWLLESNPWSGDNVRQRAVRRGMSPERLIFAPGLPMSEHLARLPLADLFLDTLPFNAGATASPALWAGLPLLTCMGEALASRMGASLLRAIGLPELVTNKPADYEALAVALALDTQRYQEVREKLRHNRLTAPLFDVPRFTRHLEAAYSAMYERLQADLLPDHIHIARIPNAQPK